MLAPGIQSHVSQRKKCVYIYNGEKQEMSLVSWGRGLGPALPGLEEEQPVCPAGSPGSLAPVRHYYLFSSVLRTEGVTIQHNEREDRLGRSMLAV